MIRTWICIHALNKGQEILFSACHIAGDASTLHWFTILNAVHTCHCLLNESSTLLPCIFAQYTGSSGWGCSNLRMDVQFTCNKIKALYEKSPVNVKIEPPSIFSFTRYTVACWVLDQNGLKNPYACVGRSSILCSTQVASIACLKQHISCLFHLLLPRLSPAGGLWSWNFGCAVNAEVPVPKPVPPSPVPVEPKAPPVEDPRAGVPNPPVRLGVPNPVVAPRPVAPKVLVPRDVPNVDPDVRLVLPSPAVVPNGFPRDAVPAVPKEPVKPAGFVWKLPIPRVTKMYQNCYQVGFITYK